MWLIFCGAYDNERKKGNGCGSESGASSRMEQRKFNFLQCFFFIGGGWDILAVTDAKRQKT